MARWRLTDKHYLSTLSDGKPGAEWMYEETSPTTAKKARKLFPVPQFLDPEDVTCHNYLGDIIVCHEGKGQSRDIVMVGPPTPDMEPLDDEAQAITDKARPTWIHPIESLPGQQGYSQSMLDTLTRQLAEAMTGAKQAVAAPMNVAVPSMDDFKALQAQVQALVARNAELEASRDSEPASIRRSM